MPRAHYTGPRHAFPTAAVVQNRDFDELFWKAAAFRDAVSSVSNYHVAMFMSVVGTLHAKLPIYLQTEWGNSNSSITVAADRNKDRMPSL
jgi:hypothetical protein